MKQKFYLTLAFQFFLLGLASIFLVINFENIINKELTVAIGLVIISSLVGMIEQLFS